jgi:hypothetical protein
MLLWSIEGTIYLENDDSWTNPQPIRLLRRTRRKVEAPRLFTRNSAWTAASVRGSLPENTASWQVCLSKDAFRRRLESVEREKLNPPAGLRASHEWMGDVPTIPEAGRQNPGSDKTPSSSAPQIPLNQMNSKKL